MFAEEISVLTENANCMILVSYSLIIIGLPKVGSVWRWNVSNRYTDSESRCNDVIEPATMVLYKRAATGRSIYRWGTRSLVCSWYVDFGCCSPGTSRSATSDLKLHKTP